MRTHDQLDKPYSPSRFYLNKHEGKFMGVCAGLADYTGIEALWWRVGLFVSLWMTGGMTLFLYLLVTMMNTLGVGTGLRQILTGLIIVAVITLAGSRRGVRE